MEQPHCYLISGYDIERYIYCKLAVRILCGWGACIPATSDPGQKFRLVSLGSVLSLHREAQHHELCSPWVNRSFALFYFIVNLRPQVMDNDSDICCFWSYTEPHIDLVVSEFEVRFQSLLSVCLPAGHIVPSQRRVHHAKSYDFVFSRCWFQVQVEEYYQHASCR
jgi:hypothetical protein